MKHSFLLLALAAAAITSCTSAYKTGQTPDDVYFSPQRPQSEYVAVKDNDDDRYYNGDDYYSDRQLRMKVQNRNQWSNLDEYYYNTDRNGYSYYNGFYGNNPWTEMEIEVLPTDGPSFEAKVKGAISEQSVSKYQPGEEIYVKYVSSDHSRVAIDHS